MAPADRIERLDDLIAAKCNKGKLAHVISYHSFNIDFGDDAWSLDTFEEFLSQFDGPFDSGDITLSINDLRLELTLAGVGNGATYGVVAHIESRDRDAIDAQAYHCSIPPPKIVEKRQKVFIGHGALSNGET